MILRVKDFASKVGSGVTPRGGADIYLSEGIPFFRSQNITNEGLLLDDIVYISEEINESMSSTKLFKGDVLLNITGASIGRCYYLPDNFSDGNVNQHVCIIRPKKNVISSFLYYNLISKIGQEQIAFSQTGANREGLAKEDICNFRFNIPSLKEQKVIVDFLDKKTAEIDTQISLIDKKVTALQKLKQSLISSVVTKGLTPNVELKDSGIEWLGTIPAHWEVKRLKDVAYLYSGLTGKSGDDFSPEPEAGMKPYIPFTNILNNNEIDPSIVNYVRISDNEIQNVVKKGDLIFLMSSEDYESIAKSAVVTSEIDTMYLNSFCRGLRITYNSLCSKFLNYLLSANICRDALRFEARGFTRINIKIDKIASHLIFFPPLTEQQAIADYLDKKTAEIDTQIDVLNKKATTYKKLKQSLIDEVVTGKRKI